jgi:hypothetical protein
LGTISLPATDDEEVSLFNWCENIIRSKDTASSELHTLQASLIEKDAQIKELEERLEELVKLKADHENALLEKFSMLLNEKKLKIRDQQRLLSASNVDPGKLEAVARSRDTRSRSAGPSRSGKRKQVIEDDESDEGFEKMDVEKEQVDTTNDSEDDGRRTPDPESTASEASDDDDPPQSPTRKTAEKINEEDVSSSATATAKEVSPPPPRRELPFQQKKSAPKRAAAPAAAGSDTESDDEL